MACQPARGIHAIPVVPTGAEPLHDSPRNSDGRDRGDVESDARLISVINCWPTLPDPLKAAILAMIGAAK
jgi:hypothetical protein